MPKQYLFEVRMKEGVREGSRSWGTSGIPEFTVEPGTIGYVIKDYRGSYGVIWEGYPEYPLSLDRGWTVDKNNVEKIV